MFEEILTDRLRLRGLVAKDAEEMFAYRGCPEVFLFQSWEPQSLDEVRMFIKLMSSTEFNAPGWYQLAIEHQGEGTLIGDCGVHILETDSRMAEFGITIAPAYQSKGYATEAVKAILELLFVKLGKHRVIASVDPRNLPSMALMQGLGLRKEGLFLQSVWFKDGWVDDVIFAILAGEWHAKHTTSRDILDAAK